MVEVLQPRGWRAPARSGDALIVFVKAPVARRVKTRLTQVLSPEEAARLYVCFVKDTMRSLGSLEDSSVWIAYEPHPRFPDPSWCHPSAPFVRQRGRDLGERMIRAVADVRAVAAAAGTPVSRVVIVGSDAPGMPVSRVMEAHDALGRADVVVGPSVDGGFYLIGMSRACPGLFDGVDWSSGQVLCRTVANAARRACSVHELPVHRDIDTLHDLRWLTRHLTHQWLQPSAPLTCLHLYDLLRQPSFLRRFYGVGSTRDAGPEGGRDVASPPGVSPAESRTSRPSRSRTATSECSPPEHLEWLRARRARVGSSCRRAHCTRPVVVPPRRLAPDTTT